MSNVVYRARKIITMNPVEPQATHLAVRDGRVLAVGDLDRMKAWGPFELDERFADKVLMPGFVEGHCHLTEGGIWDIPYVGRFDRRGPDGRIWPGVDSIDALVKRLVGLDTELGAGGAPDDQPLVAWGFDPIYFGTERLTAEHLDRVSRHRRVIVVHSNGHVLSVNRAMLADAGITRETEVEGVLRFPDGEPNGELRERSAMFMVVKRVRRASLVSQMDVAGMRNFADMATMAGVTTATDLINSLSEVDLANLREATGAEDYSVRLLPAFLAFHGAHTAAEGAEHVRGLVQKSTDRLRFGLVKMSLDGAIQGFSARLRWPGYFNGAPNGIWVTAPAKFERDFEIYHRAGLTIHTHTNGDEASEVAIAAIERVLARAPRPGHRHTLQHAQMVDGPMFRRMAELGLSANLFANHLWYWGDQHHEVTLGPDRAARLDACRSALQAGVKLAIHSDAPVTPLGPLFTAWCAVNRVTPSGRVLGEGERISVEQALWAITQGAAWTLGLEQELGMLACGKRADLAILEDDPMQVDPMRLKDIGVWGTMLSGRIFRSLAA